jgi:hypothetical protein
VSQDARILSTSACAALGVRSENVNTHIQGVVEKTPKIAPVHQSAAEIQQLFPLMGEHLEND